MPRLLTSFVVVGAVAAVLSGCSNSPLLEKDTYSQMFTKKPDLFAAPDWAKADVTGNNIQLGPSGPVAPDDLVAADGRCAPPVETAAAPAAAPQAAAPEPSPTAAAPPSDRPVGSVAGDLASAPMPKAPKRVATTGSAPPPDRLVPEGRGAPGAAMPTPAFLGGVALGMTECQVVRRAGPPSNVAIGGDANGTRKVVLSYLGGNWPGIYHFQSGRLKVIDAAPEQAKPVAKSKSRRQKAKKKPAARTSSRHEAERVYVQ